MSQRALGKALNISAGTVSAWECRNRLGKSAQRLLAGFACATADSRRKIADQRREVAQQEAKVIATFTMHDEWRSLGIWEIAGGRRFDAERRARRIVEAFTESADLPSDAVDPNLPVQESWARIQTEARSLNWVAGAFSDDFPECSDALSPEQLEAFQARCVDLYTRAVFNKQIASLTTASLTTDRASPDSQQERDANRYQFVKSHFGETLLALHRHVEAMTSFAAQYNNFDELVDAMMANKLAEASRLSNSGTATAHVIARDDALTEVRLNIRASECSRD